MKVLTDRWQTALGRLVSTRPDAFAGTDLDPRTVVARMEKLVAKVEGLTADARRAPEPRLSATELLAAKLRSALANNAMGGRTHDEPKGRGPGDTVKEAQAAWHRLPPIQTAEARALEVRFRDACRRLGFGGDHGRRHTNGSASAAPTQAQPPQVVAEAEAEREPASV
jgi:hypothetical protein